jgi:hypothetical protein
VIVLQENNRGSTVAMFETMIAQAGLTIAFVDRAFAERTKDDHMYYVGIMRAGDAAPDWARGSNA